MGHGLLARVLTGWTGDITYEGDGDVAIEPRARESAASLFARLTSSVRALDGALLTWTADANGVVSVSSSAAFNIVFTGNCGARTGFTGTYSGAASHTAAVAVPSAWVPSRGARLVSPLLATSGRGQAVGDGSAASPPMRGAAGSRYVAWDDEAALALGYEYDYWHDGRLFGRFVIDGARHVPLGITRVTNAITLELDVREVT